METFAKGRVELVEFPLQQESSITGISLAEFYKKYKIKVLICAVQRGTQVYIPDEICPAARRQASHSGISSRDGNFL